MTGDLFYCSCCELVYLERDTEYLWTDGARFCTTCGSLVSKVPESEVDLGIVDYLA